MIFGAAEADAILAPIDAHGWFENQALRVAPAIAQPLVRNWRGLRTELGLPLIPAALVASRTTMADAILPILPILFFATQKESREIFSKGYWPPSAPLTFVVLPYIRGLYDEYMERVWGERERNWVKEIQPRFAQAADATANADQGLAGDDEDDGENVFEIEIDLNIENLGRVVVEEDTDDDDDGFQQINNVDHEDQAPEQAPPLNAPPIDVQQEADRRAEELANQLRAAVAQPPPGPAQPVIRREANLAISITRMAETVLGALVFPSISAAMGELIRLALPSAWTTPRALGWGYRNSRLASPTGLLQTLWGRSVVGGCLFVVLKDALRVYGKWRMAQAFRTRRVLDWDRKKGRVVR